MSDAFIRKLELFGPLPEADRRLLDKVTTRTRTLRADQDIIREGDTPSDVHLVLEGLCCRYKILPDGVRQNLAFLIPGDFCDLHIFILKAMDHTIATLARSTIVDIPRARILEMTERPALARALWWATLVDEAILREWLVNIGVRDATRRIAHLFCEMDLRMRAVGLVTNAGFEFPLTQTELGQTLGLTNVHINRSIHKLRNQGLIDVQHQRITILDMAGLKGFCGFNPNYLHLDKGRPETTSLEKTTSENAFRLESSCLTTPTP